MPRRPFGRPGQIGLVGVGSRRVNRDRCPDVALLAVVDVVLQHALEAIWAIVDDRSRVADAVELLIYGRAPCLCAFGRLAVDFSHLVTGVDPESGTRDARQAVDIGADPDAV